MRPFLASRQSCSSESSPRSYSTKASGLGMGLSISKAIVKAHGGLLWAENNANRGATFHFTLKTDGSTTPAA
jgi:two-component system sensor kinase FixL